MKRTVAVASLTAAVALLAAGCMSGSSGDRSARKAALGSTTSGAAIGSLTIAGVPSTPVDLYGFSWGAVGGGGAHTNHVTLVKKIDPVSSNLTRATLTGQILTSVTIQLFPVGGRPYATYELANVIVEEVDHSAGDGDEQVALAAGGCVSFTPANGTRVGWDNARTRAC